MQVGKFSRSRPLRKFSATLSVTLTDKARLAWLTMKAKKMDTRPLDLVTAEDFILQNVGKRVYTSFFEPLLRSKFGERRSEVSACMADQPDKNQVRPGYLRRTAGLPERGLPPPY